MIPTWLTLVLFGYALVVTAIGGILAKKYENEVTARRLAEDALSHEMSQRLKQAVRDHL